MSHQIRLGTPWTLHEISPASVPATSELGHRYIYERRFAWVANLVGETTVWLRIPSLSQPTRIVLNNVALTTGMAGVSGETLIFNVTRHLQPRNRLQVCTPDLPNPSADWIPTLVVEPGELAIVSTGLRAEYGEENETLRLHLQLLDRTELTHLLGRVTIKGNKFVQNHTFLLQGGSGHHTLQLGFLAPPVSETVVALVHVAFDLGVPETVEHFFETQLSPVDLLEKRTVELPSGYPKTPIENTGWLIQQLNDETVTQLQLPAEAPLDLWQNWFARYAPSIQSISSPPKA